MAPAAGIRRVAALGGLLAVLWHGSARAQESMFSLQFLGMSEETGDVRARGMGLLGVALPDDKTAITLNPAGHAALPRMTLSVMGVGGSRWSHEPDQSIQRGVARFPHERFALPVPGKVVVSVGFVSLRNFSSEFQLQPRQIDGLEYTQSFERSGTLYVVPLGVAHAFGTHVQLGATLDVHLGTADEGWKTTGDSLVSFRSRRRGTFSGENVTLGALVTPMRWLHLGLTASPSVHLDRSELTTIDDPRIAGNGSTFRDVTVLTQVRFPATWRGGAAFDLGPHWTVSADGMRRDWAPYDGRYYGAESVGLESRVAGGFEYRPMSNVGWRRLAYRAGLSRLTWPQRVGGNPVRETAVHWGVGYSLRGGAGRFDLGFEYARIGAMDLNGRDETQFRFLVGFSGQETWKRRRPG